MPRADASPSFTPAPLPVAVLADAERVACLRLIRSDHVGPATFREVINHCGGAEAALAALPDLVRRGGGPQPRICSKSRAEDELEAAERAGARSLFTIEPGYPKALSALALPPPMLYVKGDTALLARPALAIVGSRQASGAGLKLARHFASELGRAGLVVVSGLARGIDGAAHEAALDSGTVAVLAGGIDVVYPPEHGELQRRIGEMGILVSEMPPGFRPRGKDFPRRNRIVSGISLGVLVVEAARRSGTLVTARLAGEQGREVFAVPGHPLDPRAEGTNMLLKTGATLVTEPSDIAEALAPMAGLGAGSFREIAPEPAASPWPDAPPPSLSDKERDAVLALLGPQPVAVDALVQESGLPARAVSTILMELDLAGRIERHGQGLVSRTTQS